MNNKLYDYIVNEKGHRAYRKDAFSRAEEYKALGLSDRERMTRRFEELCALEEPIILDCEEICFTRTIRSVPDVFTADEWSAVREKHFIHELGYHSNLTVDYAYVLEYGLEAVASESDEYTKRSIEALLSLCKRYENAARAMGREDMAYTLSRVPRYGAESFKEALQSLRIINFALWLEGNYHNTLGRFDKYMRPYFDRDMEKGIINEESALSLIEDFFLSLNKDSDLYPGIQQGDDGQSLMLGGSDIGFSLLSRLCIEASGNLMLIDPKINVRVDKNTPSEVYTLCSSLTAKGLGFPQYSNDDIVIKALTDLGYEKEDAEDYTVAACWEFIIPSKGEDIPNIGALSLPGVLDTCIHRDLKESESFEEFLGFIKKEINSQCDAICGSTADAYFVPSPLLERLMRRDGGAKYVNYGIHGVGLSDAADSLAAIRKHVFEDKTLDKDTLIEAIDADFEGYPELLHTLRYETDKLGCGSELADDSLSTLLYMFSDALAGRRNDKGGIWRAGTGSAMFYLSMADKIGASASGRRRGEPFAANYSVGIITRPDGPFSILSSMTAPDLTRACNGGPLTLEFHSSVFASEDATRAVGEFVRQFVLMGGHQLQLNAVNKEVLLDAQEHPENYPHLIVRIWGWSAYFVELDKVYQDHVIKRQEYRL